MSEFEHDIFVSHSSIDNANGWVAAFVEQLKKGLDIALGGRNESRVFFDLRDIDPDLPLSEHLHSKVTRSRILLVLLSTGYARSKWCQFERQAFLNRFANPLSEHRVVLVDLGNLGKDKKPTEFAELRGHLFFKPESDGADTGEVYGYPIPLLTHPDHGTFFRAVSSLSNTLAEHISNLGGAPDNGKKRPHPEVRVFVAQSTPDLRDQRQDVAEFLDDHFTVSPLRNEEFPDEWSTWSRRVQDEIDKANVIVQLVGSLPGKVIPGSSEGQRLVPTQFQMARASGKPVFLWRNIDPSEVEDESRVLAVLKSASFWNSLDEFKHEIQKKSKPVELSRGPQRESARSGRKRTVFIQSSLEDEKQARSLARLLKRFDCRALTPLYEGTPEEIRVDLEDSLRQCHGLILLWGRISTGALRQQYRQIRKQLSLQCELSPELSEPTMAVFEGRPPGKKDPGIEDDDLNWIKRGDRQFARDLQDWLSEVHAGGAS